MQITFTVHYQTIPGQELFIVGSSKLLGHWDAVKAQKMTYLENGFWKISLATTQKQGRLE